MYEQQSHHNQKVMYTYLFSIANLIFPTNP